MAESDNHTPFPDIDKKMSDAGYTEQPETRTTTQREEPKRFFNTTPDIREPVESIDKTRPDYSDAIAVLDRTSDTDTREQITSNKLEYALVGTQIAGFTSIKTLPDEGTSRVPSYWAGKGGKS